MNNKLKIIIIGKRDQMGTTPVIRLKGMSRLIYPFEWDPEIKHYAYEPKNQRECDDIFRTQNTLYRTMRFSVWLGSQDESREPEVEELVPESLQPSPKKKRGRPPKRKSDKEELAELAEDYNNR